jgi:hypothetical protein
MSEQVVETVYGQYEKYEIIKQTGIFSSPKFVVRSSKGKFSGTFESLSAAVEWAKRQ